MHLCWDLVELKERDWVKGAVKNKSKQSWCKKTIHLIMNTSKSLQNNIQLCITFIELVFLNLSYMKDGIPSFGDWERADFEELNLTEA